MKKGNGRTPSLDAQLKQLQIRLKKANQVAARGIQENIRKFDAMSVAAEKDLKRLKGVGRSALRSFRSELKRSWKDLKRIAQQQF